MSQIQIALPPHPSVLRPAAVPQNNVADWHLHFWQPESTAIAALCVGEVTTSISVRSLDDLV